MNVEVASGDGNKEHDIENWRKSDPCYKVTENMDELHTIVL